MAVAEEKNAVLASKGVFGDITQEAKAGLDGSCESAAVTVAGASSQIPKFVYVTYRDHVFFRNVMTPPTESVIREVVGWVKNENDEIMLIECDRPVPQGFSGCNGVVVLKNCIVAMAELDKSDFEQILKSKMGLYKNRVRAPSQRSEKLTPKNKRKGPN